MSKRTIPDLQVDTGQETGDLTRKCQGKETHGAVEGGFEDTDAEEKTAVVTPDEESQQVALGDLATPTSNTNSVGHFFSSRKRTPPKDSEKVILADMITVAEGWLSLKWSVLSEEQQLRLSFIMVREYKKYLPKFFASNSPFLPMLLEQGLQSPEEAVRASLKDGTKCGKRLARLIYKGGDFLTRVCDRDALPSSVATFAEYLETRVIWKSSETSTTIFNQLHENGQVEPFIRLQEEGSDLCYLIQSSNAVYYHLKLRMVRGDKSITPFNLNNARHIRDLYAADLSCKHVFVAFGGQVTDTLKDILQLGNPETAKEMLWTYPCLDPIAPLISIIESRLKTSGPAIANICVFDEFQQADRAIFAGVYKEKSKVTFSGKHTLLLIGVRQSTDDDKEDGGGYYGLFQNTWKNRPLWVEIGFDLLESMKCKFSFINYELCFEKEFDSYEGEPYVFSQSSMPPPEFTVCEKVPAATIGHGDNDRESDDTDDTDHESGDVKRRAVPSSFDYSPQNEKDAIYLIK
jgi:hypothetical protein